MKNIIFDLGCVVFHRDAKKTPQEIMEFFTFVRQEPPPHFWEQYDRGTLTQTEVYEELSQFKGRSVEYCRDIVKQSIIRQDVVEPTARLIEDLKAAGYKLYVLSNMSRDYIDNLRQRPIYKYFDGDVVSCEEGAIKPEAKIYNRLLERFELEPSESIFIDDRAANIEAARNIGIAGFHFDYPNAEESCRRLRQMLLGDKK